MRYSSPLKLFPELDQTGIKPDASFLINLKKRMLAEFQLNEEKPLFLNGTYYSKDDLLQLLERLKEGDVFSFHLKIWNDKNLLNFLENNVLPQNIPDWESLKQEESFIRFVSPYFSETFNILLAEKFKQGDSFAVAKMIRFPKLVTEHDELRMYVQVQRSVYSQLKELRIVIEQLDSKLFREKPAALKKYYNNTLIESLNSLPDSFMGLRNQFGTELINLYVQAYNSLKRPELAEEIILSAARLRVDDYERGLLDERIDEIKKLRKGSSSSSGSGDNSVWVILKVIGIVIYVLIMIARGCGNSNKSSSNMPRFEYDNYNTYSLKTKNSPAKLNDGIISGINLECIKNISSTLEPTKDYSRPKTGEQVFVPLDDSSSLLTETNNGAEVMSVENEEPGKLMVVNKSNFDVVVMLAEEEARHLYLRKKDSLLFLNLPTGGCEIIIYKGKKWNRATCFYTIGADIYKRCGMFDPLSRDKPVSHLKTNVYFSNIEDKQQLEIRDTTLNVTPIMLSQKKIKKMKALNLVDN